MARNPTYPLVSLRDLLRVIPPARRVVLGVLLVRHTHYLTRVVDELVAHGPEGENFHELSPFFEHGAAEGRLEAARLIGLGLPYRDRDDIPTPNPWGYEILIFELERAGVVLSGPQLRRAWADFRNGFRLEVYLGQRHGTIDDLFWHLHA